MFIRMHTRTSCYIAMSLLHHIQLTADVHTTAITSHSMLDRLAPLRRRRMGGGPPAGEGRPP